MYMSLTRAGFHMNKTQALLQYLACCGVILFRDQFCKAESKLQLQRGMFCKKVIRLALCSLKFLVLHFWWGIFILRPEIAPQTSFGWYLIILDTF